ncbi:hypothetical protein NL778_07395 [Pseudomonas putida]|nr:hypothetical protein [Pseudomonas putida]UTL82613.1 hypothetical protein NL778_07395 [Pseudomonas putida]
MFFGVAEPVKHFTTPPVGDPGTVAWAASWIPMPAP